jgi:hypothetical protein
MRRYNRLRRAGRGRGAGDRSSYVRGVAADALDLARRQRVLEMQADEVQAWLSRDHATLVLRAVLAEYREIDPVEAGRVAGTPDDVAYVGRSTVLQEGQAGADADGPR